MFGCITPEWLDAIANFIIAVTAVIGGYFAICQWKESCRIKRAEFVNGLIEKIRDNKKYSKTIYFLEYGNDRIGDDNKCWYETECFHKGKELEQNVDRILSMFCFILYLKENEIITEEDFDLFRYKISKICEDRGIQLYLWNLYHFTKESGTPCGFQLLIDYAKKQNLLPEWFDNANADTAKDISDRTLTFGNTKENTAD